MALGLAVVLRTFVIQTYSIPSVSMVPTLKVGDRILVDKLSYHLHPVHRGDVVVFATPPKEIPILMVKDLVKRVIGLPGRDDLLRSARLRSSSTARPSPSPG